jgi:septal ring factor EnvC (AmiA/AmiB activator)
MAFRWPLSIHLAPFAAGIPTLATIKVARFLPPILQENSFIRRILIALAAMRQSFRVAGRGMLAGSHMSLSSAETFLRKAKQQISQRDINDSFLKAIAELTREIKRLEDEIRRVRRDVQVSRRF